MAVFRISDLRPYAISEQINVKVEREITLEIGEEGETLILDEAGNILLSYSKEQENFVSTVAKVLERDRKKNGKAKKCKITES